MLGGVIAVSGVPLVERSVVFSGDPLLVPGIVSGEPLVVVRGSSRTLFRGGPR